MYVWAEMFVLGINYYLLAFFNIFCFSSFSEILRIFFFYLPNDFGKARLFLAKYIQAPLAYMMPGTDILKQRGNFSRPHLLKKCHQNEDHFVVQWTGLSCNLFIRTQQALTVADYRKRKV